MKLGIILQSNKPEHVWNTFRLGTTALKAVHKVEIFLMMTENGGKFLSEEYRLKHSKCYQEKNVC